MIRLLVQFKTNQVFEYNGLELLGTYKCLNKAIEDGLSVCDQTVDFMFVNSGNQYLRIK